MSAKSLLGFLAARWRKPSKCAACGGEFACGATLAGCWCAEIELSDAARAELKQRYQGCLCRACLEKVAHNAGAS